MSGCYFLVGTNCECNGDSPFNLRSDEATSSRRMFALEWNDISLKTSQAGALAAAQVLITLFYRLQPSSTGRNVVRSTVHLFFRSITFCFVACVCLDLIIET